MFPLTYDLDELGWAWLIFHLKTPNFVECKCSLSSTAPIE